MQRLYLQVPERVHLAQPQELPCYPAIKLENPIGSLPLFLLYSFWVNLLLDWNNDNQTER